MRIQKPFPQEKQPQALHLERNVNEWNTELKVCHAGGPPQPVNALPMPAMGV